MLISLPPDYWRAKHLFSGFDKATLEQAERLLNYVGLYQKRKLMAGDLFLDSRSYWNLLWL